MQIQQQYPRLPEHVRPEILRRLTLPELLVVCERFGARAIASRLKVDLASVIEAAANRGQK